MYREMLRILAYLTTTIASFSKAIVDTLTIFAVSFSLANVSSLISTYIFAISCFFFFFFFFNVTVCYAPFWKHVLGFWSRRNNGNLLFLKYEDMKAVINSVRHVRKFLAVFNFLN